MSLMQSCTQPCKPFGCHRFRSPFQPKRLRRIGKPRRESRTWRSSFDVVVGMVRCWFVFLDTNRFLKKLLFILFCSSLLTVHNPFHLKTRNSRLAMSPHLSDHDRVVTTLEKFTRQDTIVSQRLLRYEVRRCGLVRLKRPPRKGLYVVLWSESPQLRYDVYTLKKILVDNLTS